MPGCLAIITARGGSKRIPRKNLKFFLGQPIIKYSIDAAIESGCFNEIMVSTDDEEIAELSKKLGAKVPFMRSKEASNDIATTAEVIKEVIDEYRKRGTKFHYACCIYPTAPFITVDKIKRGFTVLIENDVDSVIPVVRFSYPIQRALRIDNKRLRRINPENEFERSQDLEPSYHDVGQFYWFKVSSFLSNGRMISDNTMPMIISELEMQDLDNPDDWEIAELKYLHLYGE